MSAGPALVRLHAVARLRPRAVSLPVVARPSNVFPVADRE